MSRARHLSRRSSAWARRFFENGVFGLDVAYIHVRSFPGPSAWHWLRLQPPSSGINSTVVFILYHRATISTYIMGDAVNMPESTLPYPPLHLDKKFVVLTDWLVLFALEIR
jgi:hypothetical protein